MDAGAGSVIVNLGRVGVYCAEIRFMRDRAAANAAALEIDQLGFGALWVGGGIGQGTPLFEVLEETLAASERIPVVAAILSIWTETAAAAAGEQQRISSLHPDRFLLGLGTSHVPLVKPELRPLLNKPRSAMSAYLDELDELLGDGASRSRILAANGPRMLELARERSLGSHPYLVTVEHTRMARETLGAEPLLAPQQAVVLERDPDRARAIARQNFASYFGMPNYTGNWLRLGFGPADLKDGGSDRLIDALVAWGDEEAIEARVKEHLAAGADHVALMVMQEERGLPHEQWRRLAPLAEIDYTAER